MAQVALKKSFGPQGTAKVTLGNKSVRVQMNGEVYELEKDAWNSSLPAGEYDLLLSKGLDKIISIRPPSPGTHIVRFKELGNRVDNVPQPKIQRGGPRTNQNGGKYIANDKLVFHAILEVMGGTQYDGLELFDSLVYGFEQEPGSPNAMISMEGRRDLEKFETFFRAQGINIGDVVIPFAPNVLPWLEDFLKDNGKPFMVTTNDKGFIETRSAVPAGLLKTAEKKPAKKKAAKK